MKHLIHLVILMVIMGLGSRALFILTQSYWAIVGMNLAWLVIYYILFNKFWKDEESQEESN